ncbi:glutamine synthetase family protein [Yoonia sp. GPGPB17]|uniref:glutamine synthetase family protein n=1 Tax=Yoonia sp. GPGPB17 TaxID=3026147 RepID=UPI0030BFA35F
MSWLDDHPDIRNLRCGAADLNGQARGKRLPRRFAQKLEKDGARFPLSVLNLDIRGEDIHDSPLVFETGDADGLMLPTERGYVPMPWLSAPTALLPLWSFTDDGAPFAGDPRHALARVLDRFKERGLTPVVATEMEFYLVDDSGTGIRPPQSPRSGKRRAGGEILSLRALDAFDAFFNDLYDACDAMNIPAEAAISEGGEGQFEVNLEHVPDALKAADDAWLFKMLVRGLARRHGMAASFMAKPYTDHAGTGLHTHFSILDEDGKNAFANDTFEGTSLLQNAIAGCLTCIPDLALIFAPHGNSYERLVPGQHAPTGICWAYENRTATIRVPGGSFAARRIEHRLAGGDANPYLFLAAVLGSALVGIEDRKTPPLPISGNAYDQDLPQVPSRWEDAIDRFERSHLARRIFDPQLVDNLIRTKRQEMAHFAEMTREEQIDHYLDLV